MTKSSNKMTNNVNLGKLSSSVQFVHQSKPPRGYVITTQEKCWQIGNDSGKVVMAG